MELLAPLRSYNTALVAFGATMLGAGAGLVGTFLLLRGRAMISDAIGHATLPGIVGAFMIGSMVWGDGHDLLLLVAGAGIAALLGIFGVQYVAAHRRSSEDVAIATILATGYGLGLVLLTVAQAMPSAGQAGLEKFLLGSTAGMLREEALLITIGAVVVTVLLLAFFKELRLLCFDPLFLEAHGWPMRRLDLILLASMLAIVIVGLKVVGLVLVVAVLVLPPAAARLCTDRLGRMVGLSTLIGGAGAFLGTWISAILPRLPTGPVIVLVLALVFVLCLGWSTACGRPSPSEAHRAGAAS